MNAEQKDQIRELHSSGLGYKKIAAQLGLSVNTVASFCKRQRGSESCPHCPQCGRSVVQTPHRKPKRFCSTQCHNTWWNHHAVSGNGKLQQLCPICKEPFFAYPSSHRKYCSRLCYGKYRKDHYVSNHSFDFEKLDACWIGHAGGIPKNQHHNCRTFRHIFVQYIP